jgi:tRNA pseudouridine55 synthase
MTTPAPSRTPSGFVNLLKPPGLTSRQAVARVRTVTGVRKAGHGGTLDPAAAGVLVVALGRATRLVSYLGAAAKAYRAEITLGIHTDTLDAEGRITARGSAARLSADALRAALQRFRGRIAQTPPMYSALRRRGRRLHQLARAGKRVDRSPRQVTIERIALQGFWPGDTARALIDVVCSGGTYVRTLAADIGAALELPAYLSFLVRTRVGDFRLARAVALEELAARRAAGGIASAVTPVDAPLAGRPAVTLNEMDAVAARQGKEVAVDSGAWRDSQRPPTGEGGQVAMYDESGGLVGIACVDDSGTALRPRLILGDDEDT